MIHCKDCKHWIPSVAYKHTHGICGEISAVADRQIGSSIPEGENGPAFLVTRMPHEAFPLRTTPDFGCLLGERHPVTVTVSNPGNRYTAEEVARLFKIGVTESLITGERIYHIWSNEPYE